MEHGKKGEVEENLDKVRLPTLQAMAATWKRREDSVLPEPELASPAWAPVPITGRKEERRGLPRDGTLDPQSVNAHLILPADLKSVQCGSVPQGLPDHQDRLDCVLAEFGASRPSPQANSIGKCR